MSVIQGFKNIFLGEEDVVQDEDYNTVYSDKKKETVDTMATTSTSYGSSSTTTTTGTAAASTYSRPSSYSDGSLKIVLARPEKFSEVSEIGSDINAGKTVLLNLENVKNDDAKRILDFISGVAYANDAKIKMMAQKTFAVIPRNVEFVGDDLMSELENNGYSF